MESFSESAVVLTGIQPTGSPHLGNYLGMIAPAFELARHHQTFIFIADSHALTTVHQPERLSVVIDETAATLLALGLDPEHAVFYRQSAVPEIFELMWILACVTPKGLLNRAHAYKAAGETNRTGGRDQESGIHMGLYSYPLLMAADILVMGADVVPVGRDQQQHVEMARDIAMAFNQVFGTVLNIPTALVREGVQTVTGIDGRKMSKSYHNEIPVLAAPGDLKQRVARIVTDSRRPDEPKDPEACNIFALFRHFADDAAVNQMRSRYGNGGFTYAEAKAALVAALDERFGAARLRFGRLINDRHELAHILEKGAAQARVKARLTLARVKSAVGLGDSY